MHRHDCQPKTGKTTIQQIAESALGRRKKTSKKVWQRNKIYNYYTEQHNSTITQLNHNIHTYIYIYNHIPTWIEGPLILSKQNIVAQLTPQPPYRGAAAAAKALKDTCAPPSTKTFQPMRPEMRSTRKPRCGSCGSPKFEHPKIPDVGGCSPTHPEKTCLSKWKSSSPSSSEN